MFEQQRLSRRLYDALDQVGASENLRKIHQRSASKLEIIQTITTKSKQSRNIEDKVKVLVYICGSRYEGSVTPELASDVDYIFCNNEPPVMLDPAGTLHGRSFLMIKDEWTYPGYVKLHWVLNCQPLIYSDWLRPDNTLYDVIGRQCRERIKIPGVRMQGPAGMSINEDGKHIVDTVIAFRCDTIPVSANAWITRQRHHNWPTKEQLETMSKMGCMVVSVGYWRSCEPDIEWRMSFSLQERVLMSSLNTVQHKVYIVLKMIKKDILGKTIHGESLSSYHCKTCILYAVEQTPADFWTKDKMINCVLYCLRLLLWWVKEGLCPNYFIEEHNLFAKEKFLRVKYPLQMALKRLIKMKHLIPYLLETDCIRCILSDGGLQIMKMCVEPSSTIDEKRNKYIIELKGHVIRNIYYYCINILHTYKDIPYSLYDIQYSNYINCYPKHDTQTAVNYLRPWLHLYIAKYLSAQAIITEDKHSGDKLLRRADEHFCCTSGTDVTSVRFTKASIMYTYGKYEECRRLLLEIETDLTDQVLSHCPYRNKFIYYTLSCLKRFDLKKKLSQLSVTSIVQHHIASCVVFTRSESRIAPTALRYEMYRSLDTEPGSRYEDEEFWFDFAVVDQHVYLYFLQYLVYEALYDDLNKQLALDNLEAEIEKCNDNYTRSGECRLGHKDTAYNLLTWIYLRKKNDAKAIRYFTESLKIQPNDNAARFLIRDMYLL